MCLIFHKNYTQGELFVGDQSGAIHIWDLKTDHNEQLVRMWQLLNINWLVILSEVKYGIPHLVCIVNVVDLKTCLFTLITSIIITADQSLLLLLPPAFAVR